MELNTASVFDILNELLKRPSEEIDYAVLALMIKRKLNAHKVMDLYAQALEVWSDDLKDLGTEYSTSILELLLLLKTENKSNSKAIHRALYNLNTSKKYKMDTLNKKFNYNEEEDKKLSWYWREKNGK